MDKDSIISDIKFLTVKKRIESDKLYDTPEYCESKQINENSIKNLQRIIERKLSIINPVPFGLNIYFGNNIECRITDKTILGDNNCLEFCRILFSDYNTVIDQITQYKYNTVITQKYKIIKQGDLSSMLINIIINVWKKKRWDYIKKKYLYII